MKNRLTELSLPPRRGKDRACPEPAEGMGVGGGSVSTSLSKGVKPYLIGFALIVAGLVVGCGQGTYPLDIFYEMHYQQSHKSHEPPRLAGVENAVPVDWVPAPKSTSFNTGEHLYNVNCAMCHGSGAKGDGPVLRTMMEKYGYKTAVDPDLTSPGVVAMGAKGMQGFMFSGVVVMPSFKKLMTPREMELVAEYVVSLQ